MKILKNKKGAMEMSVGTIVTIVLLMTVLILGLLLIRNIFTGAKYNVDIIDEKIRGEINKLFTEDQALVVFLANQKAEIKQGETWGVAWALKNLNEGTTDSSKLTYEVIATDTTGCGSLTKETATTYINPGQEETAGIPLGPGKTNYEISRVNIPQTAPLCTIRYRIYTKLDNQDYETSFFDVKIKA